MKTLMVQKYLPIVPTLTITIVLGWNSMWVVKVGIGTGVWLIEMPLTTD
jgi:hypothetical protein